MIMAAWREIKTAFFLLIFFTLLTGLIYPVVVTVLAQWLFPWQANGSLIEHNGKTIGSILIGQHFTDPNYFWGRPSATAPFPYNAANSSGSNLGPSNPALINAVKDRIAKMNSIDPGNPNFIPVDLVTASGSGLDAEISPYAALYQAKRVAKNRGIEPSVVEQLIFQYIHQRSFGVLGEPRVNVLELNLALDNKTYVKRR